MTAIIVAATLCFFGLLGVNAILVIRLMSTNRELAKLLASRNFTEYSLGEARTAKAAIEQKPSDEGYASAWDSEEN
jgi:hypothetical protein